MELSSARRDRLAKAAFGLPGQRKYPMPDKSHAANAKSRASQQYNRGALSSGQKSQIDVKADRVLKMAKR